MTRISLLILVLGVAACGSDDIDSDEEARRAYLGLDLSIEKSLQLGFDGFNAAQSANIPPQMTAGAAGGTLTINGQVDQGSSDNKGMRLRVGMVGYTEGTQEIEYEGDTVEVDLTYDTTDVIEMQPSLDLSLRNIPNGTFTGTLTGVYTMRGDIEGEATLNLMFSGMIKDDGTGKVVRTPAMTTITGTATSGDGTFNVNLTL